VFSSIRKLPHEYISKIDKTGNKIVSYEFR
jgi:hypothetical protein